ncbi:TMEM175 family protein [Nocardioides marmoribigeumensis]|uniref:Membrane protein n=1 Tax=Nocardioides marmoribigeumensis TaxID=433649 RepID=A0ABU2BUU5_9ACTN|nr:TMEM175 family protein [Nocardioides marmoribigeumensis]MDR7362405.1 putative membrane protein [Nocardioides marmoribigeumensis]
MRRSRLEAFSDGVLAIVITIMVLELHRPEGPHFADLAESWNGLLSYAISFVYVGIYWNNHHHLFQLVRQVDGMVLWANLHLLFWLSLLPFTTAWTDETHFAQDPTMVYGVNLLMAGVAYYLLQLTLKRLDPHGHLDRALGADLKGRSSPVLYVIGILAALVSTWLSVAVFVGVAAMWLVPDRRVERTIAEVHGDGSPEPL